ncbi:DUF1080 domain-containing protein [Robertkochia marina]|uniref:DUF1080 domain-containing protein n=1 Tax=Robertkochia marina TaxID=1227945 RepID=A0A4S3M029_9FLAO|nr:DUF1080 domain-containing protein [Robertkochia marina]THD66821.1 DUF1080 domain-containing protein [Robertkochia marina]TRZ40888.1 DUF1080 domain-containing protein [Robertkochia marina]
MNKIKYTIYALFFCFSCAKSPEDQTPWVNLFEGTLEGWNQKGGNASYSVREGAIVGTTVHDTPNSFLTTNKMYDDFILELEYKVDSSMNSGIQIRSNSIPHYKNGRVHGYQIEIDPSERAWSGGIYDEGRRGWLYTLKEDLRAQKAFIQNDWNHYRIEAYGDTLKTWVNGIPVAHLIDDKTRKGFIGLQVHSIGKEQEEGTEIVWRNIKILTDSLEKYSKDMPLPPLITANHIMHDESKNGWQLLWDGKTTEGWRGARSEKFPEKGWIIEDGALVVLASDGAESAAGGDIVTTGVYGNFELMVDFKITEGANSGIKYYVNTDLNKGPGSSIGLEYQILDDALHPDATLGNHEGSRTLASLYDLIPADTAKLVNPVGQWNTAHIVSKDNHVEHWLNGMKVLEYERGSATFRKLVSESKYNIWPGFGEIPAGPVLLQDHGNRVSFKNIKIKSLDKELNDD